MNTEEYSKAAVEVLDILDNTNKEDVKKIPSSFIKFLVDIASTNYEVNFEHTKSIEELKTQEKAQEILGYIYINWWCDDKEKKIYKEKLEQIRIKKQEELNKKYNSNIFENKNASTKKDSNKDKLTLLYTEKTDNCSYKTKSEKIELIEYKENFLRNIMNKIIKFFK